ncbi:unnamed protein product [Rotaria sp. Silwood1]|nr:unnamed protein product [Rotaria sp. Silwood1]
MKQSVIKYKQKFIHDHIDYDVYDDYENYTDQNMTNFIFPNGTTAVDEYEYDDLDSEDERDKFEEIEDILGICDQINWNVMNKNCSNIT